MPPKRKKTEVKEETKVEETIKEEKSEESNTNNIETAENTLKEESEKVFQKSYSDTHKHPRLQEEIKMKEEIRNLEIRKSHVSHQLVENKNHLMTTMTMKTKIVIAILTITTTIIITEDLICSLRIMKTQQRLKAIQVMK